MDGKSHDDWSVRFFCQMDQTSSWEDQFSRALRYVRASTRYRPGERQTWATKKEKGWRPIPTNRSRCPRICLLDHRPADGRTPGVLWSSVDAKQSRAVRPPSSLFLLGGFLGSRFFLGRCCLLRRFLLRRRLLQSNGRGDQLRSFLRGFLRWFLRLCCHTVSP